MNEAEQPYLRGDPASTRAAPAQARDSRPIDAVPPPIPQTGAGQEASLPTAVATLRRRWRFIALWFVVCFAIAASLILRLEPRYRAEALVMLDTRQVQYSEMRSVITATGIDPTIARSEVDVLSSDGLARRVIDDLRLGEMEEFKPKASSKAGLVALAASGVDWLAKQGLPLQQQSAWLNEVVRDMQAPEVGAAREDSLLQAYRKRRGVFNDGRSYVIRVSFQAADPELAARIANRHAEIYIEDQRRMKNDALAGASGWLDREVQELSGRLVDAERAVQNYRERNRLFTSSGSSVVEQRLTDLNAQLTAARADLAQRMARRDRARTLASRGESLNDVNDNNNIGRLREQEAIALRAVGDASSIYGARHPTVIAARANLREVQTKIAESERKVLAAIDSEVVIARSRVAELQAAVQEAEERMAMNERAGAGLRELEREAAAVRSLYESLLIRQKQVSTQEGIQHADSRVVSRANPPAQPSFPNSTLFLGVAGIISLGSGVGIALGRERIRSGLESADEVENVLGVPVLGVVPLVPRGTTLPRRVADHPKSVAAEAMRNLRHRLILSTPERQPPRRIAITSAVPGEGKTSVSLALARSMASAGLSVLVIDTDLRRPAVAPAVWGRPAQRGIVAVLEGRLGFEEAVQQDPLSPLHILPAETTADAPQDLLASRAFLELVETATRNYDHVVMDTPPSGALSDAVLVGRASDTTLVVVRCNQAPRAAVLGAVRHITSGGVPVRGAILNGIDLDKVPQSAAELHYHYRASKQYFKN